MAVKLPKDKFMSSVKVGEKGQIVIPKEVREMFGIEPGDMLLLGLVSIRTLLLADQERGIAILDNAGFLDMASQVAGFAGREKKEEKEP